MASLTLAVAGGHPMAGDRRSGGGGVAAAAQTLSHAPRPHDVYSRRGFRRASAASGGRKRLPSE